MTTGGAEPRRNGNSKSTLVELLEWGGNLGLVSVKIPKQTG